LVRDVRHVTVVGTGSSVSVSDVLGADHAAQSLSSSNQFVFEFPHAV
jgi:hypothetical protein